MMMAGPTVEEQGPERMLVYVYLAGTKTLATIYSDEHGTLKPNPFPTDSSGRIFFYAPEMTGPASVAYEITWEPLDILTA